MNHRTRQGLDVSAGVEAGSGLRAGVGLSTRYELECRDRHGRLKWREVFDNLVVNAGLDDNLSKYFKGSAYTAAHYVGLTAGSPTFAAGDTMSSHAGWTEVTDYSQEDRPALTLGNVSGQSVDNSASKAEFSITDAATIGGAFIATDNTKGGSAGTLYGGGAFSGGNRSLANGDTLNVTVTLSAAAA